MKKTFLTAAAALFIAGPANAYDFPIFVPKGDVQSVLGLNNPQLQAGTYVFTLHEENEWECIKDGVNTQEKNNTVSGLFSSTERVRNQITGFWIEGFDGNVRHNGPPTGQCPNENSGYVATDVRTTGGGILVNGVPLPE